MAKREHGAWFVQFLLHAFRRLTTEVNIVEMLKITQCPDRSRWYSSKIGDTVPFLGDVGNEYKSIEVDGYINFVRYDDAVIVKT